MRGLVTLMSALMATPLDQGSARFGPSNLEFTSIDIGNPVVNLSPGEARARFNIRFKMASSSARAPRVTCVGGPLSGEGLTPPFGESRHLLPAHYRVFSPRAD